MRFNASTLLRESGLLPKRSFGQNFLTAEGIARAISEAAVPDAEVGKARVLELGAGLGALTALLSDRAREVVALERDRDFIPLLEAAFEEERRQGKLRVVEADAQTFDAASLLGSELADSPRVVAGNLPYQITGRLLERVIGQAANLDRVVFMVQLEVADRIAASPGTKAYGALTVFVRAAFDVKKLMNVSPGCFHPRPDVTSAVIRLTPMRPARAAETPTFRAVVKSAFLSRRKTLRNAWQPLGLPAPTLESLAAECGISLDARGETLDVDAFARMATSIERLTS